MQNNRVYLAVCITGDSVADLGALSAAMFAREELARHNYMVKVRCLSESELSGEVLQADVVKFRPMVVVIVDGWVGKVDLLVYHQVLPDWERYRRSYQVASGIVFHSRRLRKMHNRYAQAGYMYRWLQELPVPAVYMRLDMPEVNMDELYMQGRVIACTLH